MREKGTNRSKFLRGQVDKYTWVNNGDSYLPSELNAAYLWPQLEHAEEINKARLDAWDLYYKQLFSLKKTGKLDLPMIPDGCIHNAHMFYIKVRDIEERTALIVYLKEHGVQAVFHYIPLHSAPAGIRYGRFYGKDRFTTQESNRLLRLPMYYGITNKEIETVTTCIKSFFQQEK